MLKSDFDLSILSQIKCVAFYSIESDRRINSQITKNFFRLTGGFISLMSIYFLDFI